MATKASAERTRWAVDTLAPNPDDLLLEIGCGPGDAVSLICERLTSGRIVAIDRSATAVSRAAKRNAANVAAGKAVLQTIALEKLNPSDMLQGQERFDKILALNVNLFWTRNPAKELDLIRGMLAPGGALYLFYGYGGDSPAGVPSKLLEQLAAGGFAVETRTGTGVACVVATPE